MPGRPHPCRSAMNRLSAANSSISVNGSSAELLGKRPRPSLRSELSRLQRHNHARSDRDQRPPRLTKCRTSVPARDAGMDVLAVAGVAIPLGMALGLAAWFMGAWWRKQRRTNTPTRHAFRGQGEAVTVAELLQEAAAQKEAVQAPRPETDYGRGPR